MATVDTAIKITMDDREAGDILITALEGGIGYWCCADAIVRAGGDDWYYQSFRAFDAEDESTLLGHVTLDTVRKGVDLVVNGKMNVNTYYREMVLHHFTEDDPMDAGGADIVVQAGLLGEVVYE